MRKVIPQWLDTRRHSLAHIMAQAVLEKRPDAKLGFGPATEDGFYYDFLFATPLTSDELPAIEARMRQIVREDEVFQRGDLAVDEAVAQLEAMGQEFKVEYCRELAAAGNATIRLYRSGDFVDMCEGPHVERTSVIPDDSFALDSIAGAYWRGDESRPMLTRIYGLAFETREELEAFKARRELAKQRDHRKLGKELDIFHISDQVGQGLALWLPNGAVLIDELEKLAKEMEFRDGYVPVRTPHISKSRLYLTSGHLPYYKESMYPPMQLEGEDDYYLKPMNCPHHHIIYASRPRSYRDLPLRLTEYGAVYRYEQSGELAGLLRVRGMWMNDAHLYCTPDQVKAEFIKVLELHRFYYSLFRITDFWVRLSLGDPTSKKFAGSMDSWETTEDMARKALIDAGFPFEEVRGEAAFYGPKVDHQMSNVVGREETASTTQLDLVMPERFGLTFIGPDGLEHRPIIIHRAPLGTHERFVAFLLEHLGGVFPTWLSPVQVRVLPVSEGQQAYGQRVVDALRDTLLRATLDASSESLNKRIRAAEVHKIPNMLVVGKREEADGTVTWRRKGHRLQVTLPLDRYVAALQETIARRLMDNFEDVEVPGFAAG
ncbi:threonine--tRNA ligase [Candidatus Fermentibacteria bacterium]|nr:threonine--tRNA ligase [Candidatus Fermentibacteria bacterium]